jgi:hypothetical protein
LEYKVADYPERIHYYLTSAVVSVSLEHSRTRIFPF